MYRGTRAGKNKNQQEQARPIEGGEHQRPASPTPSFHFGEIAAVLTTPEPFVLRSIYPNFSNALSLAHRLGVKPTTETVETLEVYERAKESTARPSKCPRVNSEEEVDIYWTSDEEDVDMFLHSSAAGPSSRCALTASPLEATDPSFTGYNTTPATSNTTRCSVWFLCETRSPGYRVRHLSREPCRFPRRPAKCERRTRLQHIEAPTIPTGSRPSKRPRLRCDRGLRGAQRSLHDRNTGSGLGPLRDSNSRPRVCGPFLPTLFPFSPP